MHFLRITDLKITFFCSFVTIDGSADPNTGSVYMLNSNGATDMWTRQSTTTSMDR